MGSVLSEVESLRRELEQVREESLTDALTGISNRKAFDIALDRVISESGGADSLFACCWPISTISRSSTIHSAIW